MCLTEIRLNRFYNHLLIRSARLRAHSPTLQFPIQVCVKLHGHRNWVLAWRSDRRRRGVSLTGDEAPVKRRRFSATTLWTPSMFMYVRIDVSHSCVILLD